MRRPRGAVNLVSLTLTVAFLSGAYLAWIYVPLWLDNLDVKQAVSAGVGQLTSELGADPERVRAEVVRRLSNVGSHWEERDGRQVEVPGLGLDAGDVKLERDGETKVVRLTVDYHRTVKLVPLERYWSVPFHVTREGVTR
ncbi:MAG TPA: hypothetical protein VFN45_09885 [Myxococcaceae bacterium]|nr:hypothetical protein [Myxococcaceae bacterium]